MELLKIIVFITLLGLFSYLILATLQDYMLYRRMKKKEEFLKRSGINPSNADYSHGMEIDKDGKIISTKHLNMSWYKKLRN